MMQVWAGFQLPSRNNENAQCQVLHHSGERCIKQSFCALTSSSSNMKHRNLPARSAEFITSSCPGCRVKFSFCCDIQLQPWDLRGLCEIIGMHSIFITLTQGKKKLPRHFFFPRTLSTSFISPLLLYCLCLPAQHFSSIMAHFRQKQPWKHIKGDSQMCWSVDNGHWGRY